MKCIIGLGNPGRKYENTRHNIGFMVIDELLRRYQTTLSREKFNGLYTIEHIKQEKVLFVEPQTFMNRSGECIRPLIDYFNIDLDNVLVIYDDLDLPIGKIRLRQQGGHGGHNGIRSLIDHLGTKKFKRIRVGIGRPTQQMSIVDYVLQRFSSDQLDGVNESIMQSADACEQWFKDDFSQVMNVFN